ncbi:YchJ family metal-binding protein [Streptomyces sp. V4-01]|uniref:UPF0225 protein V2S66_12390 n=1 Tax=Actinacidiphila polyblastidii TaxID=3110430 RepID=A0ABU7PAB4_9ACTN|nr:YchJ family metal-binding protein [Streptomyces sp. V4-01]
MPRRRPAPSAPPASPAAAAPCPCGLGAPYGECCGPFHTGRSTAPTAERLMRSRYAAFAVRDPAYLLRTWSAGTRPAQLQLDHAVRWTALDILATTGGTAFHREGTVEFTAHYRLDGHDGEQHENSRFLREHGHWVYVAPLP